MSFITPDWPAPANVRSLITTREDGVSAAPFDGLNLGLHVGDNPHKILANWRSVIARSDLVAMPCLLTQMHGRQVVEQQSSGLGNLSENADGVFSRQLNTPCAILSADCLPVLLCNSQGTQVAALHAGWRGLAKGVLDAGVASFATNDSLLAYLGPAICGQCFQVGREVLDTFIEKFSVNGVGKLSRQTVEDCFVQQDDVHWLADIYQLARLNLLQLGVSAIYGGDHCTVEQEDSFYSYRRDGTTGRFASIIWLE